MNEHIEGPQLTAYADGAMTAELSHQLEAHLSSCEKCKIELDNILDVKRRLEGLPNLKAPPQLMSQLKNTYLVDSLWGRIWNALRPKSLWKPAGAFTVVALLTGAWFIQNKWANDDDLS